MIIAQITGGLGNQLFQYAAAKALSLHHHVPLFYEVSSFYREDLPELEVPRNFELFHFKGINEQIMPAEKVNSIVGVPKNSLLHRKIIPAYRKSIYAEPHYHYDRNFFKSKSRCS